MYYAIMGQDVEGSLPLRKTVREQHLARVQALVEEGRLLVAGPHPKIDTEDPGEAGFSGSLIIAEFPSLEAAEAWAKGDPYHTHGVFAQVQVKPFKVVLP